MQTGFSNNFELTLISVLQFPMAYHRVCSVILILVSTLNLCAGQYAVPEVKFEAFTPKGLRISIPAEKGVELFAFHGKLNKPISQIEPGEFSEDVTRPNNGRFTYINPSIKLKEGDQINYWVFVQHDQLGFRKDDQSWTVGKLLSQSDLDKAPQETCTRSITRVQGKTNICSGDDIINYRFTESTPNPQVWLIEQYIPNNPDWEYVIYKNEPDVVGVENNVFRIRPKVVEDNVQKNIEIEGCTRQGNPQECLRVYEGIYQPPIVSARMVSREAFYLANISIRAKLPQGDWVYPQIYLEDVNKPGKRILLAYARGNQELTGNNGIDIGGTLLFGGPIKSPKEPERSKYLSSWKGQKHIGDDWHVFAVRWANDQMELFIDDVNFGVINADALQKTEFNKESMVRLVLGVGAGGLNDFPDNYKSGQAVKPWKNLGATAIKNFYLKRDQWQSTWNSNTQLLVEYVTVKAL